VHLVLDTSEISFCIDNAWIMERGQELNVLNCTIYYLRYVL